MPNHLMYDYAVHFKNLRPLLGYPTVSAFSAKVNNLFTLFCSFLKSVIFRLRKLGHFWKLPKCD